MPMGVCSQRGAGDTPSIGRPRNGLGTFSFVQRHVSIYEVQTAGLVIEGMVCPHALYCIDRDHAACL